MSLSQLIAFLAFQLRVAWGLAVLAAQPVTVPADPARTASTPDPAGAAR
ncbi:hypothetical protein CMMCA002_10615 [Clavibacter michiganensis subsp. michiganensis]|nr:hypothetical protein [Clavibacter michiganensis]OUE16597.1 hypothetical protein CMMCA002_10615 [Clavibacter michiganensis subsp. michiganensis]